MSDEDQRVAGGRAYVLAFEQIDRTQAAAVGGKGARLAELSRIEDISVLSGFCVTTAAFRRFMAAAPSLDRHLERLSGLKPEDHSAISQLSTALRQTLERVAIPTQLTEPITSQLALLGDGAGWAVRSSATAEDLPNASFAGQQDSYLNIIGSASVLEHIRRCWASLFTERAVTYRLRSGFDHRDVAMAVVVQQMVIPQASGVLFTADPVSGNRRVAAVEACFGLGEALVSGLVSADSYRVRDGAIVKREIAAKQCAVSPLPAGGTQQVAIDPAEQRTPALTDAQVIQLVELGRLTEAHFGDPQDIEWCLADGRFHIVQSRPITTLFPIPVAADQEPHLYLSVGHQQMMTDPMKPLGLSMWKLTALPPMHEAGGRLFVDVARALSSPATRPGLLSTVGRGDPLTGDALRTILARGFITLRPDEDPSMAPPVAAPEPIDTDPAIVTELIARNQESVATLAREIETRTGPDLLDFILGDLAELKRLLFDPRSHQVFMSAMDSTGWLNQHLLEWLGETNAADVLTQSVAHNVTSEMGLALLDVADVIRPHAAVVACLENVEDETFIERLPAVPGGNDAAAAIRSFLDTYGMRCVGEIDITRPRWSERPSALVPLILSNVRNFGGGAGERRFEQGRQAALAKRADVLARLATLPEGDQKVSETTWHIDRVRTFIGYREYPKYGMISRYLVYKRALMAEAERLTAAQVIADAEDVFFLTFQEFHDVIRTRRVDNQLIRRRRDAFAAYQALRPPRVLTSEGEVFNGSYQREDVPQGALVGLAVSAGTVEGRARVVLDMASADLEAGDILVTAYTDPSWTPLFVTVAGVVTEVGGLMTHGAVIAREYGLPAVVGVSHATTLIQDGQRIRVHGTEGYVEIVT